MFKTISKLVALVSVMGLSIAFMPQVHNTLIRKITGSQVVKVLSPSQRSGGTGWFYNNKEGKTFVMTNAHVCMLADKRDELEIMDSEGGTLIGKVYKRAKNTDLCAIEIDEHRYGLDIAFNQYNGEVLAIVGHPALRPLTISRGEVIGYDTIELIFGVNMDENKCIGRTEKINPKRSFQELIMAMQGINDICIAKIKATQFAGISYGGNSGSPVVDFFGRVSGVLFAGSSQVTDTYLIRLEEVKEFVKSLDE